jgi:hypothetical protein
VQVQELLRTFAIPVTSDMQYSSASIQNAQDAAVGVLVSHGMRMRMLLMQ